jgi:hypothetical protein
LSGHFSESVLDRTIIPSLNQVDALFESDDDALLLIDTDGRIVNVSSEWVLLCGDNGMMENTTQGSEISDLLHRVRHDGRPRSATIYNHHGRGFQLKLDATILPVAGDNGAVTGFLARLRPAP